MGANVAAWITRQASQTLYLSVVTMGELHRGAMLLAEQSARRVGRVRRMNRPAGEVPQQPAVDGAGHEIAARCGLAGAIDVIQNPRKLGGGEIRIEQQAGASDRALCLVRLEVNGWDGLHQTSVVRP